MPDGGFQLTPRWETLRDHAEQTRYLESPHRFNVVPAGRRSGKTECAKRKVVIRAYEASTPWTPRFFCAAPTRDQAKRIYWDDLKALIAAEDRWKVSETDLMVKLVTGAEIWVLGMDKPQRIEGQPWDGGVLDEYANMKPTAWSENVRPALSDRKGWCDLIGVPEGRNHYYLTYKKALAEMKAHGAKSEWGAFTWFSSTVLDQAEVDAARRDLDELTFQQEYEASFINFRGRVYYPFQDTTHCAPLKRYYDDKKVLSFTLDFNVEPGSACVVQEGAIGTLILGEVHVKKNSNTEIVCNRLIQDWGSHQGPVRIYGDATGGNRGTAKLVGSDWDIVEDVFRRAIREKDVKWRSLELRVKESNPRERARINALNTRLKSGEGAVRLWVDPRECPETVKDFEGVQYVEGGSGEIDKKKDTTRTHWTDGLGYYCDYEYPVLDDRFTKMKVGGA